MTPPTITRLDLTLRVCRRCEHPRPLDHFYVYKYGEYGPQRRRVCKFCTNRYAREWQRRKQNWTAKPRVPNTPDLRAALLRLRDHYGEIDAMVKATGISKSTYHRIVRVGAPSVQRETARTILQAAYDIGPTKRGS